MSEEEDDVVVVGVYCGFTGDTDRIRILLLVFGGDGGMVVMIKGLLDVIDDMIYK